jgi:hypothetical protein
LVPPFRKSALLTARDKPGNFQGLLKEDGSEFQFCVSNLGDGYLSFNIVQDGDWKPINEVNAVRSKASYLIPCDQRTKKAMKIQAKKTDDGKTHLTVEEAETKGGAGTLKFTVNIKPQKGNKEFAEGPGTWECVPGIVVKEPAPVQYRGLRSGYLEGYDGGEAVALSASYNGGSRGGGLERSAGSSSSLRGWFSKGKKKKSAPPAQANALARQSDGLEFSQGAPAEEEEASFGGDLFGSYGGPPAYKSLDIGKTSAVDLAYGDKEIEVKTASVNFEIDLEVENPFTLGISLWEKMELLPLGDVGEQLAAEIKYLKENHGKELLKAVRQIFKSETCCIDLESPADTVIIQCGHQCVNHANLKGLDKCPMCRGRVVAFVAANE